MACQVGRLRRLLSHATKQTLSDALNRPRAPSPGKRHQRCFAQQSARPAWSSRQPNPLQRAAAIAQHAGELAQLDGEASSDDTAAAEKPGSQQGIPQAKFKAAPAGAFQRIPQVPEPEDHLRSALKRANRVSGNKKIKGKLQHARNLSARRLDALTKELAGPLGAVVKGFPTCRQMHPFERALLDLTLGIESYEKRLSKLNNLRKTCLEVGKSYAGQVGKAVTVREATQVMDDGFKSVEDAFRKSATSLESVKDIARVLRKLPTVDPTTPTVALVGAPNVGKSSLVQVLSSGLPEVCNYPFTTRTVKMGHFFVDGRRHQVTDTPGLLNRKEAERNAMERLTLACLEHLPTAVIFVADLTGECGTSLEDQWAIRQRLRHAFPAKPWLDAFSKADLLTAVFAEADALSQQEGGGGMDGGLLGPEQVLPPVAFVAALPSALRISSTQHLGIDELKATVLGMLAQAKSDLRGESPDATPPSQPVPHALNERAAEPATV